MASFRMRSLHVYSFMSIPAQQCGPVLQPRGLVNIKKRFFVLKDDLAYYDSDKQYEKGKEPKGVVVLDCHYTCPVEGSELEFAVHAYPRTLMCKASNAEEMQEWISVLKRTCDEDED